MLNLLLLRPISHFLLSLSGVGQNIEKGLLPGFKTIFVHEPTLRAGNVITWQLHCSGNVKNVFSLGPSQTQKFLDKSLFIKHHIRAKNTVCRSYFWRGAGNLLSEFLLLQSLHSLRDALKVLAVVLHLTRWVAAAQGHVSLIRVLSLSPFHGHWVSCLVPVTLEKKLGPL